MTLAEIAIVVGIGLFLQYLVIRFATAAAINDVLTKRERGKERLS